MRTCACTLPLCRGRACGPNPPCNRHRDLPRRPLPLGTRMQLHALPPRPNHAAPNPDAARRSFCHRALLAELACFLTWLAGFSVFVLLWQVRR